MTAEPVVAVVLVGDESTGVQGGGGEDEHTRVELA